MGRFLDNLTEVDSVDKALKKALGDIKTISRNEQDMNMVRTGCEHEQSMNRDRTDPEHAMDCSRTVHEQSINTVNEHGLDSGSEQDVDSIQNEQGMDRVTLTAKQTIVYDYFLRKGLRGTFNKTTIEKNVTLSYTTVRRTINKFVKHNIISIEYDECTLHFDYIFNPNVAVKRTVVEQGVSSIRTSPLIKTDRQILKKSFFLTHEIASNPDLEFWKNLSVPEKKLNTWMTTFEFTEAQFIKQLCYSAYFFKHESKSKIKSPCDYFYHTCQKSGGFSKPSDYKTPEEKRKDLLDVEIAAQEKLLQEIRKRKEKLENLKFEMWVEELAPEKRKEIINSSKLSVKQKQKGSGPAIEAVFKGYYGKNQI